MNKELFLLLYKQGKFNFDYFNNCDVCNSELCKFYNDIILTSKKNFNKIDALYDLVNISVALNKLNNEVSILTTYNNSYLEHINNLIGFLHKDKIPFTISFFENFKNDILLMQQSGEFIDNNVDLYCLFDIIDNKIKSLNDGNFYDEKL